MEPALAEPLKVLGRYALYDVIASGGMARVHLARLLGPVGFSRTVAIKRLHPHFASDPEFVSMFLDEARLAARISHPNVVSTLDVVATEGELFLVMEYVQGESFSRLIRAASPEQPLLPKYVASVISGVLHGLHAAHEAKSERGEPLGLVHRDVSPQNILVGIEGLSRVLDFGIAKAAGRIQTTREGHLKGKMAYMAPEQLQGKRVDRRTDVFAASIVLWEALTAQRLFKGDNDVAVFGRVLEGQIPRPSTLVSGLPPGLDDIVLRGLERDPDQRFATARDMARALEQCVPPVAPAEIGEWVVKVAAQDLAVRAKRVAEIESSWSSGGVDRVLETETRVMPKAEPDATSTQLSSGSFSQPRMTLPAVRSRWLIAVVALGGALTVVLVLLFMNVGRGPATLTAAASSASADIPTASSALSSADPVATASAPAPPAASADPVASALVGVGAEPSPKPIRPPVAGPRRPSRTPGAKKFNGILDTRE